MASTTTYYKLRKPARTDNVNVQTDLNDNFDKIDNAIHEVVQKITESKDYTVGDEIAD